MSPESRSSARTRFTKRAESVMSSWESLILELYWDYKNLCNWVKLNLEAYGVALLCIDLGEDLSFSRLNRWKDDRFSIII